MNDSRSPDYKRHVILFVDDEEKARKYFHRLFDESFRILDACDGVEALRTYREHADEIGVIVTDQRMPNQTGSEFLAQLGEGARNVVKILSTAYADLEAAVDSVNRGGIYRYVSKPWDIPDMELTLKRALELYDIKRERDSLIGAKMQAVGNLLFATRLASFALVPVAAALPCRRAAEAVACFTRLGSAVAQDRAGGGYQTEWRQVHARQREFAALLRTELVQALAAADSAETATKQLLETLAAVTEVPAGPGDDGKLALPKDPFPELLTGAIAVSAAPDPRSARVLAALMAAYHAGVSVERRWAKSGVLLQLGQCSSAASDHPGDEVAKWLFDDELLMTSAIGLLG
jgi:two-component system probable response regulator PhcQ